MGRPDPRPASCRPTDRADPPEGVAGIRAMGTEGAVAGVRPWGQPVDATFPLC
jgi:hypothetical protein